MRNLLIAAVGAVTVSALVACSDTPTSSSLAAPDAGLFSQPGDTDKGIAPTEHTGNVPGETVAEVCYNLGIEGMENIEGLLHTKADWKDGIWQHEVDGEWVEWTNDHLYFSTDGSPGKYLDFKANGLVYAVVMKGGPNYNLYDYTPEGMGADGHLHSPINESGQPPYGPYDISHVNFCYVPGDNGDGDQGCTLGFWQNWTGQGPGNQTNEWPAGYEHGHELRDHFVMYDFDGALGSTTLLDALSPRGGNDDVAAARLLMAQAVAALLNAAHDNVEFELTVEQVVQAVNDALEVGDRAGMLELADELDTMNNAGCPLPLEEDA